MKNPKQVFEDRKQLFEQEENQYQQKFNHYSIIRVLVFIAFTVAIIYFANEKTFYPILYLVLAFPFVFGFIVNRHNNFRYLRDQARFAKKVNEDELDRLELKLEKFPDGQDLLERDHPYIVDLDIFGKHSLFQLLNRTVSRLGFNTLATYLKRPPSEEFIDQQQEAIKELSEEIDWRQNFEATGRHVQEEETANQVFIEWLKQPNTFLKQGFRKVYTFVGPVLMLVIILLAVTDFINNYFLYALIAFHLVLLGRIQKLAKEVHQKTSKSITALKVYHQLISKIERAEFKSERWKYLASHFKQNDDNASASIRKLQFVLDQFDSRSNFFYWIFNIIFLFDFQWLRLVEKWKEKNAENAITWIDILAEIDVINSLAGFAYANPDYNYPVIKAANQHFEGKNLGHPLIPARIRVTNDYKHYFQNQISVITGSNMSGKSTFLRTVGINLILAYVGCPVCATRLTFSRMDIFTSMRTQDDLEEHISSFYAELRRLKMLLENTEEDKNVFFLLDELLKGTNSGDRHKGAVAFLKKLSRRNVSGLASTHDVELGALADEIDQVINYHFSSTIKNDQINFDYKIKEGICKSFNASQLMINLGIMDN